MQNLSLLEAHHMNQFTHSQLRDLTSNLMLLAGTFQTDPFYLRAKQIRQADKALILTDALFSPKLCQEALQWKNAEKGLKILQNKYNLLQEKQEKIEELDKKIINLKKTTQNWFEQEETERNKINLNSKRAENFIANQNDKREAHAIHRYKRYKALKDLVPYSENASYLCESIFHYENREKYEESITKLEIKKNKAQERLATVKRGFWIAILFCCLVMTIPICFPFSISLWRRKREIESQIANTEETLRRENKRLIAADEGSVVAQEIREILGNVSLEVIREVLIEVKELRSEFLGTDRTAKSTSLLLSFLDQNKENLEKIFGTMPEEPTLSIYWLNNNVTNYQNTESIISEYENKKQELILSQKSLTKGYSKEILLNSIEKLSLVTESFIKLPFETEHKSDFIDLCIYMPELLTQVREALYFASRNQAIELHYWNLLRMKVQSSYNTLSLCLLSCDLNEKFSYDEKEIPLKKLVS
jgi:hypothetical protein